MLFFTLEVRFLNFFINSFHQLQISIIEFKGLVCFFSVIVKQSLRHINTCRTRNIYDESKLNGSKSFNNPVHKTLVQYKCLTRVLKSEAQKKVKKENQLAIEPVEGIFKVK